LSSWGRNVGRRTSTAARRLTSASSHTSVGGTNTGRFQNCRADALARVRALVESPQQRTDSHRSHKASEVEEDAVESRGISQVLLVVSDHVSAECLVHARRQTAREHRPRVATLSPRPGHRSPTHMPVRRVAVLDEHPPRCSRHVALRSSHARGRKETPRAVRHTGTDIQTQTCTKPRQHQTAMTWICLCACVCVCVCVLVRAELTSVALARCS
jgi:hypothetical protein